MRSAAYVIVLLCVCVQLVRCQTEGQSCVTTNGQSGICRPITQCQAAIIDLQNRIPPKLCGFAGGSAVTIVCCAGSGGGGATTTTTTTTTTPRPTTTTRRTTTTTKSVVTTPRRTGAVGEKAALKCKEYGEYVYVKELSVVATFDESYTKRTECAQDADVSIVGGKETKVKEFPHMALVGYDSDAGVVFKCGGSLISENFVLTAGHCLFDRETNTYAKYVRLGEYDLTQPSRTKQDIVVAEYIKHPDYKPPSKYNDIALLRLEKNAVLNDFVRPACLPTTNQINVPVAIATGWGRTSYTGEGSNKLLKVTLDFYTNYQCNETYEIERKLNSGIINSQVCAGSFNDSKDACQGDSGGPLQISNTKNVYCTYTVIGVTSFGKACGLINQPGVYTRVYSYLQWIESIVWPNF